MYKSIFAQHDKKNIFLESNCAAKTTAGYCCAFPFIYKNKRYDSCTSVDHNRLWCATTSNYDKDGKWGNCNSAQSDEPLGM